MVAQILLISAFCLPSVLLQESPVDLKAIQKSAQALATATKKGDVATLLEGTYPKAVEMMGGKGAAEKAIRSAMDDFGKKGITFTKAECSEPKEIQKVDGKWYAVVPMVLEMQVPNGLATAPSYLLGISEDGGKVWKFIDGSGLKNAKGREVMLPGIHEKLKLPTYQPPKFTPNP